MASAIGSKKCDVRSGLATGLDRLGSAPAGPAVGARNRQTDCAQSNAGKFQDRRRGTPRRRQAVARWKRTPARRAVERLVALGPRAFFARLEREQDQPRAAGAG